MTIYTASSAPGAVGRHGLPAPSPLLRRDLPDIVDMFAEFIIGLPTTTRGITMAPRLAGKIAFANIGFDGAPRHLQPGPWRL
ncbi:MAG TPA: hypothetical protein VII22_06835 [Streptosporangiaceae bacterium]